MKEQREISFWKYSIDNHKESKLKIKYFSRNMVNEENKLFIVNT